MTILQHHLRVNIKYLSNRHTSIGKIYHIHKSKQAADFLCKHNMCGIWALLGYTGDISKEIQHAFKIAHRGPDFFRIENIPHFNNVCMAFHRLSIMDDQRGQQPIRLQQYPHVVLAVNGEIYNYKQLAEKYNFQMETGMDGEVIIHLYEKFGIKTTLELLDGVFALSLFDAEKSLFHLGRDTYGVRPLFTLHTSAKELGVCSEVKGLNQLQISKRDEKISPFVPGFYASYQIEPSNGGAELLRYERYTDVDQKPMFDVSVQLSDIIEENVRNFFSEAVKKRLMSERRIGCLLSGGLDSSLVTALVVKFAQEAGITYPIQTFAVGLPSSPDIVAARKVANLLGTEHHEIIFTKEEGFEILEDVIYTLETYDPLLVRSAIANYLLCKYIKENTDTVVVFSGEGSDEVAQGYHGFHNATNHTEAHKESLRLLRELYLFGNLRADRTIAAHGLEIRLPFLDKAFCAYYLSLPKELRVPRNGVEKFLLRSSFDGQLVGMIPNEILWRSKLGFGTGIAQKDESWSSLLYKYCQSQLSNSNELEIIENKEAPDAVYYHKIFEKYFPDQNKIVPLFWTLKFYDPHYSNKKETST